MVLETEEAKIKGPAHCVSGEEPFQTAVFWRGELAWWEETGIFSALFY